MRLTHNIKPVGGGKKKKVLQKNVYDTTEYLLFVVVVVLGGRDELYTCDIFQFLCHLGSYIPSSGSRADHLKVCSFFLCLNHAMAANALEF